MEIISKNCDCLIIYYLNHITLKYDEFYKIQLFDRAIYSRLMLNSRKIYHSAILDSCIESPISLI